jgi:hypothetical protein
MGERNGVAARPAILMMSFGPACQHPALLRSMASRGGDDMNLPFIHGDVLIWHDGPENRGAEQAVDGLF